MSIQRETLELDALFVGGGPACLSGAIRLKELSMAKGMDIEIGLIEKGTSIGSHILSGAILDPIALKELIPEYIKQGCPIEQTTCNDKFYYLTKDRALPVPYTPKYMHNDHCHIVSLSKLCAWLGEIAEDKGIMVFTETTGTEVLYDDNGTRVIGIRTGDKGIDKNGNRKGKFEPGVDLIAKATVFGEGSKGSLFRELDKTLNVSSGNMPQIYETSIKEVIQLSEDSPFLKSDTNVIHSFGFPLGTEAKGGGFLYKNKNNRVSCGLVVGLDYKNPCFEPYQAYLQFKSHPLIAKIINGGKVVQQGAKTLSVGGYYTQPKLSVDGAVFVGDSAALLNSQRLKGIHTAMKSGMLAAETIYSALEKNDLSKSSFEVYDKKMKDSWIEKENYLSRNFTQALGKKGVSKLIHLGAQYFTHGRGLKDPLPIKVDSETIVPITRSVSANSANQGVEVKIDGELYVDKLTGVYLSATIHEEDQPCHILIPDPSICQDTCNPIYDSPCTRFCPGQVYEVQKNDKEKFRLVLNPSNCLHCKTCEIKCPGENITWTCPEGGGGPKYTVV